MTLSYIIGPRITQEEMCDLGVATHNCKFNNQKVGPGVSPTAKPVWATKQDLVSRK